ncbi:Hypothetical protein HVR_LOCUS1193 [uncultured virus]|nr:Hypothetical protein HVR_LOCUS1193 [uncultured virus]
MQAFVDEYNQLRSKREQELQTINRKYETQMKSFEDDPALQLFMKGSETAIFDPWHSDAKDKLTQSLDRRGIQYKVKQMGYSETYDLITIFW